MTDLLSIKNLYVEFADRADTPATIRDVSFSLDRGAAMALVGESGSGKTLTALSIMRLLPPPGYMKSGDILFDGQNLPTLSDDAMRAIRGSRISMVFQEPMTSLNPVLRIDDQICEPLLLHGKLSRRDAQARCQELLTEVGIASPAQRMSTYPHQLSGGMRQRVMIAMALACRPTLLIADEPTTALDVTIQAQILELLDTLRRTSGLSLLLITHDLGIVAERTDHTAVMYAGQIVEFAPTGELLSAPRHPYTQALLASLPQYAEPGQPLPTLTGQLSGAAAASTGCSFAERCPIAAAVCHTSAQTLREVTPAHTVRCWKAL